MTVFDTDVLSYLLRRAPPAGLIRRLASLPAEQQATTAINAAELLYGAHRVHDPSRLLDAMRRMLWPNLRVLVFDWEAAQVHGQLRAELEAAGRVVSEPDLRIASICLRHGARLATGNLRHFASIPGLEAEDWLAPHR
ncbi:MAG TPA: PIN domain-containing protein [Myxococcota bacterium]|nr:PIN domain-containing protein [Myxococcota bacterium]HRY96302.1 PIN domain-containing protein [Myxococcota bacterium]HSA23132.1 PIN domain-containing protein [Myxococcota bacterium]